ncbi:MAG: ComF family protein [Chitinispirillales bacterium]|jgi:ComF family protein|nr:ComF family protein [Chitinispirillales bacterium]
MKSQKSQRIKSRFLGLAKRAEDFLIPPLCVICNGALEHDRWLCRSCLNSLCVNHNTRNACPRCSQNRGRRDCACEFAWDYPFQKAFSIYDYDDTLRLIARHIKYKGKKRLAYHMGQISASLIPQDFFDNIDIIIPVPLHKSRMRARGYNQAEWFARGVFKGMNSCLRLHIDLLRRTKNTGTQTKLDKESRLSNLACAFAVNPHKICELKGKKLVLVDDILTTGATVEACTEELIRGGCASVRVLSMGRD